MMFRRLYWVTEEINDAGVSRVTGVYTSIPDLIRHGLRWTHGPQAQFRLSLVKLDCEQDPLGTFESPRYEGLTERLEDFVKTQEFTQDECQTLADALNEFASVKA
jgi:hypothetical protein